MLPPSPSVSSFVQPVELIVILSLSLLPNHHPKVQETDRYVRGFQSGYPEPRQAIWPKRPAHDDHVPGSEMDAYALRCFYVAANGYYWHQNKGWNGKFANNARMMPVGQLVVGHHESWHDRPNRPPTPTQPNPPSRDPTRTTGSTSFGLACASTRTQNGESVAETGEWGKAERGREGREGREGRAATRTTY